MTKLQAYIPILVLGVCLGVSFTAKAETSADSSTGRRAGLRAEPLFLANAKLNQAVNKSLTAAIETMSLRAGRDHLHWVLSLKLTDTAEINRVTLLNVMQTIDTNAGEKDLVCETEWALESKEWVQKEVVAINKACILAAGFHPSRGWRRSNEVWFPQSGALNHGEFKSVFQVFEKELSRQQAPMATWSRDSWILSAAVSSDLKPQKLWVFASALLELITPELEKRADCHGQALNKTRMGWVAESDVQCRVQNYRFVRSCLDEREENCFSEWVIIETQENKAP